MKPRNDTTLLLTNHNYGEYIFETLGCVFRQTAVPDEVIVYDDASTDHSREVLEQAAKTWPSLKIVPATANLGCCAATNLGHKIATGRYISVLGTDDPLHDPNFFARAFEQTRLYPDAGFYFGEHMLGQIGPSASFFHHTRINLAPGPRYFPRHDFADLYRSRDNLSIPTVPSLWPREALIGIGGLLEKLNWLSDWFAALVLSFRRGACYIPGVYQTIRYSPRSLSQTGISKAKAYREILIKLLLTIEEPQFADVRENFKLPAVMGRHGFKFLDLCVRDERFSSYLSLGLIRSACLTEANSFNVNLRRFGNAPPVDVLREIGRRMLSSYADQYRKEAAEFRRQGRYVRAIGCCRQALDADPTDPNLEGEIAELSALSAKWSRAEDRM